MAEGLRATIERFHTLLTNQSVGSRPLTVPLTRARDNTLRGEDIKDGVGPQYILRWRGGGGFQDNINGPRVIRVKTFSLLLSHPLREGHRAGQDARETDLDLADLWEQVHFRLEDINNLNRVTTGCLRCFNFSAGEPAEVGHRMQLIGTFQAQIDTAVGTL